MARQFCWFGLCALVGCSGESAQSRGASRPQQPTPVVTTSGSADAQASRTEVASIVRARLAWSGAHGCVIGAQGEVTCWGDNESGQCGLGKSDVEATPVVVQGIPPMKDIAAAINGTCSVATDGSLWCWGGSVTRLWARHAAKRMPGLEGVEQVAVAKDHRCALFQSGAVACWGSDNYSLELGERADQEPQRPALVTGIPSAVQVVVSDSATCILDKTLVPWCLGRINCTAEETGSGPDKRGTKPHPVQALAGSRQLSLGTRTLCGVTTGGEVRCLRCGDPSNGMPNQQRADSVQTLNLRDVKQASGIRTRVCAAANDGLLRCWGVPHYERGNGGIVNKRPGEETPPVQGVSGALEVVTTEASSCVLDTSGTVRCWGYNRDGSLGLGGLPWRAVPTTVVSPAWKAKKALAANNFGTCAIEQDGRVRCWGTTGKNAVGLTGVEPDGILAGVTDAQRLFGGGNEVCAETTAQKLMCRRWGPERSSEPELLPAGGRVGSVALGPLGKCVVALTGAVRCAPAAPASEALMTALERLTKVKQVSLGKRHACAILADGLVRCLGDNLHFQLGRKGGASSTPVVIAGPRNVDQLAASDTTTCALEASGALWCWGSDESLGGHLKQEMKVPRRVLRDVAQVVGGERHTCALTKSRAVLCWGSDRWGQLGDSEELEFKLEPVAVQNLSTPQAIVAGGNHTCALEQGGDVKCWGRNERGEISPYAPQEYYESPEPLEGVRR